MMKYTILISILVIILLFRVSESQENTASVTNKTQNVDTGKSGLTQLTNVVTENNNETSQPEPVVTMSPKLVEALQNLTTDNLQIEYSTDEIEKIKREYKSYKELKKNYNEMRKHFKTDAEIITQLIEEYRNLSTTDFPESIRAPPGKPKDKVSAQIDILENFNSLVHQVDNALWFIDAGGLEKVLLPLIVNQTNISLRVQAMRVLGAIAQNNPKAQIKVFELNFGEHLAQILIRSTNRDELSTGLYAFGGILRKFPFAQKSMLSTAGSQALITVLTKECELKIKAKAATLISDLINEKELVLQTTREPTSATMQYTGIKFAEWLQANNYCATMEFVISTNVKELMEQADILEYFVHVLETTHRICATGWVQSPQLRSSLHSLHEHYSQSDDEYHKDIVELLQGMLSKLEHVPRDEL